LLVLLGAAISLLVATNVANPTALSALLAAGLVYVTLLVYVVQRPFIGFLILCFTLFMLVVFAATDNRYINAFDAFMPFVFMAAWWGGARQEAMEQDARLNGPGHDEIRGAGTRYARAAIVYMVIAYVSLIQIVLRIGTSEAVDMLFGITRVFQGALMFPLGLWLLRTEKRISASVVAILLAGALFAVVNIAQVFASGTFRAGMTWVINHPDWPVEAANEAGASMVILWALIVANHELKPRWQTFPMLGVVLFLLFLTQSRSGILALITFSVLSLRRVRWQYLAASALLIPLALRFAPADFLTRIVRSVTFERGTMEVYTFLIRVYGYQSAWRVFADNWLFGVGYLSCQYVSHRYNDLNILDLGAENFYLETAAGLGVIGLAALAFWYLRLYQLGRVVLKLAPEGSRARVLARLHFPLMAALSVANLTGDNFMGLIGAGQLALWAAMLVQSGHVALERQRGGDAAEPGSAPT
jgi:hypothetical protein